MCLDVTQINATLGDRDDALDLDQANFADPVSTIPLTADAGDGNDHVDGGDANDSITLGNGNDNASGNGGADSLDAGGGDDDLDGGAGRDTEHGGDGNDEIFESGEIAVCCSGGAATAGDNIVTGGDGADHLDRRRHGPHLRRARRRQPPRRPRARQHLGRRG